MRGKSCAVIPEISRDSSTRLLFFPDFSVSRCRPRRRQLCPEFPAGSLSPPARIFLAWVRVLCASVAATRCRPNRDRRHLVRGISWNLITWILRRACFRSICKFYEVQLSLVLMIVYFLARLNVDITDLENRSIGTCARTWKSSDRKRERPTDDRKGQCAEIVLMDRNRSRRHARRVRRPQDAADVSNEPRTVRESIDRDIVTISRPS